MAAQNAAEDHLPEPGLNGTQPPKRLLWLIDSLNVGGAEALVVPFATGLDRRRWDLSIVALTTINGNPVESQLRALGFPVTNLGARNLRDLGAFRRLLHCARRSDLIHAHLTYAAIWGSLASRLTGVPVVASLHVAPPRAGGRDEARDRLMRVALHQWSKRTICVSDALRRQVVERGGLDAEETAVIHNGIEIGRFDADRVECRARLNREFAIPDAVPLAVTVAVLRPGKGIDVLIEAARSLPETYFLIIGDGPMKEEWMAQARAAGVATQFRWAGYQSDVASLLPGCDLLVHPSLEDAFPTVLLEAMAASLPVVATNVGGIPEIVQNGVTGTLVPPGDAAALASAISPLLWNDMAREEIGRLARERAETEFSTGAWIERLENVYDEVLA